LFDSLFRREPQVLDGKRQINSELDGAGGG
jgi:hypothetical protein